MIYSSDSLLLLTLTELVMSSSPVELLGGDSEEEASIDDIGVLPPLQLLVSFEVLSPVEEGDMVGEAFIHDVAVASHQLPLSSKLEEPMVEPRVGSSDFPPRWSGGRECSEQSHCNSTTCHRCTTTEVTTFVEIAPVGIPGSVAGKGKWKKIDEEKTPAGILELVLGREE